MINAAHFVSWVSCKIFCWFLWQLLLVSLSEYTHELGQGLQELITRFLKMNIFFYSFQNSHIVVWREETDYGMYVCKRKVSTESSSYMLTTCM